MILLRDRLLPVLLAAAVVAGCARTPAPRQPDLAVADTLTGDLRGGRPDVVEIPPLFPTYVSTPLPGADQPTERGLEFRLRERPTPADPVAPATPQPRPAATPLTAEQTATLLARLPALAVDTAGGGFAFPRRTPPPPLTGATVLAAFPPPDTVAPPPDRPTAPAALEVLRIIPEGETELAPHLTITFSQPMVPLATLAELDAREVPVRLTPQPPGRWRWIDTRTLRFEPEARFPMATLFTVEIPDGVHSALGGALPAAVRHTFATPAPRATGGYPHRHAPAHFGGPYGRYDTAGTFGLEPVIVLRFDQRIDPAAVLRSVRLTAGGRQHPVRLATEAEVDADSAARRLVADAEPDRWVALRPVRPLPRDAEVRLSIEPGAVSGEGSRTTQLRQELPFRTYPPMRVEEHGCGLARGERCPPEASWFVRFSNPLDTLAWRAEYLRVEPQVEGLRAQIMGPVLVLSGAFRPRTTYRVTLDPRVRDHWGQTLGAARTLTFEVGDPGPTLGLPGGALIVLDPAGPRRIGVHSQGHAELRVQLFRVRPEQWEEYAEAVARHRQDPALRPFSPPGERVASTTLRPEGGAEGFSESWIDLAAALPQGLGHVIVVVESTTRRPARDPRRGRYDGVSEYGPAFAWVQATRIGLSAAVDGTHLFAWTTSLDDGAALGGAELRLLPSGARATAAADGTARLTLSTGGDGVLVARRGDDTALLPDQEPGWRGRGEGMWRRNPPRDHLAWFLATDRGLYRPGERVQVKGWIRTIEGGPRGDVALPRQVTGVTYTFRGPRNEELGAGDATWGGLSGFHLAVDVPEELNLGHATFQFRARGATPSENMEMWHHIQVQEFRRPEFEVRAEVDPGPHVVGGSVNASITAAYYGGGGLPDTEVEWRVHSMPAHFTPPGWDEWRFGRMPWWWGRGPEAGPQMQSLRGRTGAAGAHHIAVDLLSVDPPFVQTLFTQAEVRDVNRQVGSASSQVLVHPAALYVGLRSERGWVRPGDTLTVRVVAVDIGGRAVSGQPVRVWAERMEWQPGPWRQAAADTATAVAECRLVSAAEPVQCALPVREPGTLRVVAEVIDEQERPSRTEWITWVAGGPPPPPSPDRPQAGEVGLVADRDSYLPGQTAEVLVQPPFYPAQGMMTLRRAGLLRSEPFHVSGPSHTLRIPITEEHIPDLHLHVSLVDTGRGVQHAAGQLQLSVSPRRRELSVEVTPRDTLAQPGGATSVDVLVRDDAGRPMPGAEVAVWMVDESVLALGGYQLPDPLQVFHPQRGPGVMDHALRTRVVLDAVNDTAYLSPHSLEGAIQVLNREYVQFGVTRRFGAGQLRRITSYRGVPIFAEQGAGTPPQVIYVPVGPHGEMQPYQLRTMIQPRDGEVELQAAAAPPPPPGAPVPLMGRAAAREEVQVAGVAFDSKQVGEDAVTLRADFAPLAFFEPSLRTGSDGRVRVPVRLPESLTRYRIMAVAVEGSTRYGRGEATLTARRELMVRLSAPRFLNFGDRAEIPVLVQNTTERPLTVDVALRAAGLVTEGAAGQRITVPAGDRAELRFPVRAERAGRAQLQVVASSGALSDASSAELPVYTPATAEAFATYGEIDTGSPVVLPVDVPQGVIPQFGGLEVTVSSTALQALTDAVLYLHHYPFEGAEQLASRILAIAALRDVLGAFAAEGLPPPAEIQAAAQRDIGRLTALQGPEGGWSLWRQGDGPPHPYVSVHAAHALARARENDYRVPDENIQRALGFLQQIERFVPRTFGPRERNALVSYALYTRARLGDRGATAQARRLVGSAQPEQLTVEAMGWLLHVLTRDAESRTETTELLRRIRNRASETAATASFATSYGDGDYLLLHSDRRSDAVVLEALIAADPRSDLIAKTARGLLAHRTRGRWQGTQENAWVLLALERYFATYEATTPNFRSGVWLAGQFAGGHPFRGRTTERHHIEIPMREVIRLTVGDTGAGSGPAASNGPRAADPNLLLQREGAGRMYYRAGLRYAPTNLTPDPTQRGFSVERSYEALDDPADVRREADGTWRVRAGARVRVRLSMIAPERRHHVALVDALPAGFEAVNPELTGVGFTDEPQPMPMPRPMPQPGIRGMERPAIVGEGPWWGRWWVHQNLRDDRAEAFATLLPAGSYEYTYIARATTPGVFVVPPPRAEEMYHPETFGRGAGVRVVVEGR